MNVRNLIEHLQQFDGDMEVHFAYNYGDYWKTTVAPEIGEVTTEFVKQSAYHDMPKIVDEDQREEDDPNVVEVVVLRT